jgi:hypothetical protein
MLSSPQSVCAMKRNMSNFLGHLVPCYNKP